MKYALIAALILAPLSPPQTNPGDQCWGHYTTTTDTNGNPLVCVFGPDTGHLTYWRPGTPADYPGR